MIIYKRGRSTHLYAAASAMTNTTATTAESSVYNMTIDNEKSFNMTAVITYLLLSEMEFVSLLSYWTKVTFSGLPISIFLIWVSLKTSFCAITSANEFHCYQ